MERPSLATERSQQTLDALFASIQEDGHEATTLAGKAMQDRTMKLSDGRTLGFSDYGNRNAIPIMHFHGTPGSRVLGLEDAPVLEEFGVRIIAPERPGYGLSDAQPGRSISDWSDDVRELADHLGIQTFHVAGESGGGPFVLACAIKMPARVLSATLIGSTCPPELLKAAKGMTLGNRIGFFLSNRMPFVVRWATRSLAKAIRRYPEKAMERIASQLCDWDKKVVEMGGAKKRKALLLHLQEAYRQGHLGHFEEAILVAHSWGIKIDSVKVPVFLWHGESDNLMPVAPAKELARLIPGCEPSFIPGAGHFLLESEEVGANILRRIVSCPSAHPPLDGPPRHAPGSVSGT